MASFREKKPVYDKLTGEQYFEPDMQLLREKLPNNPLCKRQYLKPDKHQKEALWALLDVVGKDEIVKNRRAWAKEQAKELLGKIAEEAGTLTAKMEQTGTLEALETIYTRIKEIVEPVPEKEREVMMKLADSVYAKMKDQLDPEKQKAAELEKLNQELLEVDLEKATQKVLAAYVRKLGDNLGVVPVDMKKATIQPILEQYVFNLPKVDEGGGEPKTEIPAESDKTNELVELPYTKDLIECKILFLKASTSETEAAANVFIDEIRKRVNLIPEELLKEVFGNIDWKNFKIDEEYLTSHKDVKDGLLGEIEALESELDELRDQNSELEDENEELKDENSELEARNSELENDLEAEKKSGTKAPENSKSGKSTQPSSGENSK